MGQFRTAWALGTPLGQFRTAWALLTAFGQFRTGYPSSNKYLSARFLSPGGMAQTMLARTTRTFGPPSDPPRGNLRRLRACTGRKIRAIPCGAEARGVWPNRGPAMPPRGYGTDLPRRSSLNKPAVPLCGCSRQLRRAGGLARNRGIGLPLPRSRRAPRGDLLSQSSP